MSQNICNVGKDYVPASFKGVPFYCSVADVEGGRRGAEGEFPFGEQTAYADLGRKIRTYRLTAIFRRDDHVSDSQALFDACESPGPGPLVHPTRGTVMAACRSVKVSDKIEDMAGVSEAELEFVEANSGFMAAIGGVLFGIISSGLDAASEAALIRGYYPRAVAQPWYTDVIDVAQSQVFATAQATVQVLAAESAPAYWRSYTYMLDVAQDDGLAAQASSINKALVDGKVIIGSEVQDPQTRYNVYKGLANHAVSPTASSIPLALECENAVLSRQRVLTAIGMAEAAMAMHYNYIDEALAAMDAVEAIFADEAQAAWEACENELYLQIRDYSVKFVKMMNDLAYRLPGLVKVNFVGGVHPLVAAYVIYDDAKRHRELEQRNIVDANGRFQPIVVGITPT